MDIPEIHKLQPYQFELIGHSSMAVGHPVLFLGYPFEKNYVAAHMGIISSIYNENTTTIIQIDASVNQSNSGGPLIDIKSGGVIGIITRKATGLTEIFGELKKSLVGNIELLQKHTGIAVGGVDYAQAFSMSQHQILNLLSQIERSANVGIGYAFSSIHITEDPTFQEHLERHGSGNS